MAALSSKILIFIAFLCVYIYGIKGRPNNLEDVTSAENQNNFEESNLLKSSKTKSDGQDKGHKSSRGNKKQVIDAYHLGPYHHGHSWGTISQWPGFHWGGHAAHHGGWTGYPSLGGWHRSHIPKKNSKKSVRKAASKRHMPPMLAYPSYGFAYPSLGFAALPFTSSPVPWGYGAYRSNVPEKTSQGHTRSSVKGLSASKRWWPGYMGGWGGWGTGNTGYPGWGPLGGDLWGHGFDVADTSHGWGLDVGGVYHPFLRAEIPGRSGNEEDKAEKRWWPGNLGGWGGWGLGNTGYPGWGPLGADWGHGISPYGYGHGLGHFGHGNELGQHGYGLGLHGYGLGPHGYGLGPHGYGLGPNGFGQDYGLGYGYGYGLGYRADISGKKEEKEKEGPKRQFIHGPYGAVGSPWENYGQGFPYGPFGTFGSPFIGHGAYVPYPEALYPDYPPWGYGFGPYAFANGFHSGHGLYKSKIPSGKSKKLIKEHVKEEEANGRNFVHNFHPGTYGWGGVIYPAHGHHSVFPLLGALTYNGLNGGYYGPYGPPRGSFGPYYRSTVPKYAEESGQSRQVINYHPGCYGWGGCIYPGCGCIGGWTWPLPCHFHHHSHHCVPCWTRSNAPKKEDVKEEKGDSRQDIADPGEDESESKDPRTRPHLEGADLLNSQMQNLAMGFPGIEQMQTPMGEPNNPAAQGYNNPDMDEDNRETPSPGPAQAATAEATPEEATESIPGMGGITPDEGGNGFKATMLGNMEIGQQQSAGDLMSSFNMNPSEGEMPADAFSDTGNSNIPSMYGTGGEEQATLSTSRRADIPDEEERTVIKKQAVTYPYNYLYPGYMMSHGVNPYYHYTPINYAAAQHVMTYPSVYPLTHPNLMTQPLPLSGNHHSHSIHVGAPDVNIDVHTTRGHVAQNPEKQKGRKLKEMMGDFSRKLKGKTRKSTRRRRVHKRQIPSAFQSPIINRPMGFSPVQFRYPVTNTPAFLGQSMYPSLQQSLQQTQPFEMNAMSRSGLPIMASRVMRPTALRLSAFRGPQMRYAFNPATMALSRRQLSSITGISLPISAQPGMGIVGMASRKKRSPSKKNSKKSNKTTKRQFLAGLPQPLQLAGFSPFGLPASPFAGLPIFPAIPFTQPNQMVFRPSTQPSFLARIPQPGLSAMRMGPNSGENIPGMAPFSAYPSPPNNPFVRDPRLQNINFFNGGAGRPLFAGAGRPLFAGAGRPLFAGAGGNQWSPSPAFKGGREEGLLQSFEGNPRPLVPEMGQQSGSEQPFQMNREQLAGFNPSAMGFGEQPQPSPMFSEPEGRGNEGQGPLSMVPRRQVASFFNQLPLGGGIVESNNFNMQSGLAALKKSSVPSKKHEKEKSVKSRR